MDVDLGVEYAEFRTEMREWIEGNIPSGLKELADWSWQPVAGGKRGAALARATADPIYREWVKRLLDAKLICATWPEEFGGRGWDSIRFSVFSEELRRQGVPAVRRGMGETLVGPRDTRTAGPLLATDRLGRGRLLPGLL